MVGNLPNFLTLTRILLLPFFAAALIYRDYQYALLIFAVASVTDLLDGYVARLKNQVTYFGEILDPVADKFFLITSFVLLSNSGLTPKWLTIIVISKDLIVITGSIILYFVTNQLKVTPSIWGKYASACQFILIGLVLLSLNIKGAVIIPTLIFIAIAILTSIAGIHYVYLGLKMSTPENDV
jgi:cardiolipin synthase